MPQLDAGTDSLSLARQTGEQDPPFARAQMKFTATKQLDLFSFLV
jgi:hypothetical protein